MIESMQDPNINAMIRDARSDFGDDLSVESIADMGVEELRALSFEDTDRAMALGLEMSIENLNERGKQIFHDTMDAYNWYKNLTK